MRVLIIEDEERMAALLEQGLTEEGHSVHLARNGEAGLALAQASSFDVIVLDVTLPRMDGLTVARHLRRASNQTPILMLTARDSMADIVKGLDTGADDYLTKPFAFEVLLARLRAVSRRGPIPHSVTLQCADLMLDTATRRVTRDGRLISLTPREYGILELLLRNAGRPVSRTTILESVWGFESEVEENTVEAFVRLLRNKIDAPFEPKLIHTVRGIGYCLRLPEV
ncbi:MAG: response regulator transcription factor [Acidobacteriaceae bacterium]|nr:response regulator transcription factor [Acidobacteriaceae bacterium]